MLFDTETITPYTFADFLSRTEIHTNMYVYNIFRLPYLYANIISPRDLRYDL